MCSPVFPVFILERKGTENGGRNLLHNLIRCSYNVIGRPKSKLGASKDNDEEKSETKPQKNCG